MGSSWRPFNTHARISRGLDVLLLSQGGGVLLFPKQTCVDFKAVPPQISSSSLLGEL